MSALREEDDGPHAAGPEVGWTETCAFSLYEPRSALGGLLRFDVRPNQRTAEVALSFLLPDGGFITARHVGPHTADAADLELEGATFKRLEPLRRWRIAYDGPAHSIGVARDASRREVWARSWLERLIVDLELETRHAPPAGADWIAQPGVFRGEVWVSGDRHEIDAHGSRERAWGARCGEVPLLARSFTAAFGAERAFVAQRTLRGGPGGGPDEVAGWVSLDAPPVPIRALEVATVTEPGSYLQESFRLTLRDASGAEHRVDGRVLQVAPLPGARGGLAFVECVATARFSWEGGVGFGFATYLHRLDAQGAPVVPVD